MAQLSSCIHLLNNFVTPCIRCNIYRKSHYPLSTTIAVYLVLKVQAPPISLAATLGIIHLFSSRPVTKMFQFTGFPPIKLFIHLMVLEFELYRVSPFGFPRFNWCLVHSTRLFADMHVLRRLSVPRHPPLALCSFTYFKNQLLIY